MHLVISLESAEALNRKVCRNQMKHWESALGMESALGISVVNQHWDCWDQHRESALGFSIGNQNMVVVNVVVNR